MWELEKLGVPLYRETEIMGMRKEVGSGGRWHSLEEEEEEEEEDDYDYAVMTRRLTSLSKALIFRPTDFESVGFAKI